MATRRGRRKHAAEGARIFVGGLAVSTTLGLAGVMAATQQAGHASGADSDRPRPSVYSSQQSDDSSERSSTFTTPSVTAPATSAPDTITNAS